MITILMVHNYYQSENPSGENASFESEARLLSDHGHRVIRYTRHNDEIAALSSRKKLALAKNTIWATDAYRHLKHEISIQRPDVVHFQNTFPLISPSAYLACRDARVPVVQTLRNYRLFCPNAVFFRDGHICEDCLGKRVPWPGVRHACYRASRLQTAVVAGMLTVHRLLKTWQKQIDVYIALTEFVRKKAVEGGLPEEKIVVKPNFVHPDPGVGVDKKDYALFVGRLSPEKGLWTLLRAWRQLKSIPLKIIGDGPLMNALRAFVAQEELRAIEVVGLKDREETMNFIKAAQVLVFPSEWYETFGRVAMEAFACGVPVLASRLGAMEEIVEDGRTGLLFTPGDPNDLADKMRWITKNPAALLSMRRNARQAYEARYTADQNYAALIGVYEKAIRLKKTETLRLSAV